MNVGTSPSKTRVQQIPGTTPGCTTNRPPGANRRGWAGFLGRFCGSLRIEVPLGYEDESGFHYGILPQQVESN